MKAISQLFGKGGAAQVALRVGTAGPTGVGGADPGQACVYQPCGLVQT